MKRQSFVVLTFVLAVCSFCYSADKPSQEFKSCKKSWKSVKESWTDDAALLVAARQYVTHCFSDGTLDDAGRARLFSQMGFALIHTKQFDEAIPVLEQCGLIASRLGLNGELAKCWAGLGEAAARQGFCKPARRAFKVALDVPTTDEVAAAAHELAKLWIEQLSKAERTGALWVPPLGGASCCASTLACDPESTATKSLDSGKHSYGSGFFVSSDGLLVTNDHVVSNCTSVKVGNGSNAQIVSRDPKNDLALLRVPTARAEFAVFRLGRGPNVGEGVIAFGYPLPGTLSSSGVATNGIVSSLFGLHDDPRTLQFSAAVQPGNSGGPLLDESGHVIGVVEAKLDALKIADATGSIPENVGFAIQWAQVKAFLESEGVKLVREPSTVRLSATEIVSVAQKIATSVDCTQ